MTFFLSKNEILLYSKMEQMLTQLVQIVTHLDQNNAYIPPNIAILLRNHGFPPHRSYLRAPPPPPPPPRPQCPGMTQKGTQCANKCAEGLTTCRIHSGTPILRGIPMDEFRCPEMTSSGERCKCGKYKQLPMCWRHAKRAGILPPPPEVPTECAICYTDLTAEGRVKTSCGHYFHAGCFESWKTSRTNHFQAVTCPMCRHHRPNPKPA